MINILNKSFFLFIFFVFTQLNVHAQAKDTGKTSLHPRLVKLKLDSTTYQSIFEGAPQTVSMHSGLVILKPDETVGDHNTDDYEEMLIILSGEGQMMFTKGKTFNLKYGEVAYCPPHTEHDVKNTGSALLKYLYIVAKTTQ